MWLKSDKLASLLEINLEQVKELRTENAVLKNELDILRKQLAVAQTNFDWLRVRVNTLEFERVGLMERAYNIKLPAQEIIRSTNSLPSGAFNIANLFDSLPLDEPEDKLSGRATLDIP